MKKPSFKQFFDINEVAKTISAYLPKFNKKRFIEAFEFAAHAHGDQMRKDGKTPYVVHPVMVVQILAQMHVDEDVLIAGLLHDVPEDTEYEIKDVEERFGKNVAFLVEGITKLSKVYYKNNMPERDVQSLKKMFLHGTKDPRVILIKLADRLHNMRTLQFVRPDKQARIAKETLQIYVPIGNLLGIQAIKAELEDLCFKYLFPEEYRALKKKVESYYKRHKSVVGKFMARVKKVLEDEKMKLNIYERKKNLYSIYKKISEEGKCIEELEDRIAVRIIVEHTEDCYKALGLVHRLYTPKNNRFRDYIANPKPNGYQSLHTAVFGADGFLTDIQFRSEKMQLEAQYGIAAHFFYNEKEKVINDKRSSWVSKIIEIDKSEEDSEEFLEDLKLDIFEDRIIVFDLKGTTVDLPAGASVIDFAYAVGGKKGDQLKQAEINTKKVPITGVLKSGDVVKIITSKDIAPDLWWLAFVKTNYAKNQIRKHLKKTAKPKKLMKGRKSLQKQFDIAGLGLIGSIKFSKIRKAIKEYLGETVENIDDLLIKIGEGQIRSIDVERSIRHSVRSKSSVDLNIRVVAKNRFGFLKDLYQVIYKNVDNMSYLKAWTSREQKYAYVSVKALVSDISRVGKLFSEIEQVEGVEYVYRLSGKAVAVLWTLSIFTAAFWILHPVLISVMSSSEFFMSSPIWFHFAINVLLLLLFVSLFYLTSVMKKFFPMVRGKKRLWILAFSVPALALTVLFMEIIYFDLKLSWFAIFIEISMIYAYLARNFINFKKTTA